MASGKVIPFSCFKCSDMFELTEGGVCSSCNNLFCRKHLTIDSDSKVLKNTCIDCAIKLEKFITFKGTTKSPQKT